MILNKEAKTRLTVSNINNRIIIKKRKLYENIEQRNKRTRNNADTNDREENIMITAKRKLPED